MDRLEQIKKAHKQRNTGLMVGKQGRVVIPAEVRKQLGIHEGDHLLYLVENGRLILMTGAQVDAELEVARARIPPGVSIVDELIEERRREFLKEEQELSESLKEPGNAPEDC